MFQLSPFGLGRKKKKKSFPRKLTLKISAYFSLARTVFPNKVDWCNERRASSIAILNKQASVTKGEGRMSTR